MSLLLASEMYGNGGSGDYVPSSGTDAPVDSACTGTINTKTLSATNVGFAAGQIILIIQMYGTGEGQRQLNVITNYVAGTITTKYNLDYEFITGAQVIVVNQYKTVTIGAAVTLTGKAWNGSVGGVVVRMAKTLITGNATGTITVAGKGFTGGSGTSGNGSQGGSQQAGSGEGTGGVSASQYTANGNGGGGSQRVTDKTGGGGGGGNAAAGSTGGSQGSPNNPGQGGNETGNTGLTLITLGGGGGGGNGDWPDSSHHGGDGSPGAGMVILIAPTISYLGPIVLNGNAGSSGTGGDNNSGGGGGAGGSLLVEGQVIDLGTNVTATGGAGGGHTGSAADGGAGAAGRIHVNFSNSLAGTTSPTLDYTNDRSLAYPSMGYIV